MHDLIFVSLENWDEVWRRNQFLCAGLARRFPDRKILFVGLPRDVSHGLRRGRLGALSGRAGTGRAGVPERHAPAPAEGVSQHAGLGAMGQRGAGAAANLAGGPGRWAWTGPCSG